MVSTSEFVKNIHVSVKEFPLSELKKDKYILYPPWMWTIFQELDYQGWISSSHLLHSFNEYCEYHDMPPIISHAKFGMELKALGIPTKKSNGTKYNVL